MIEAIDLETRLRGLDAVGTGPDGFHRLAWTDEDASAADWFGEQAGPLGLRVDRDPAGNLWALPDTPGPWWACGSHLDTVAGGGRYDGALGVACAFEVARACPVPVAVISFADEEGARFNTPTFGSRALAGRLDVGAVLARTDAAGMTVADAMAAAGVDPAGLATARRALERLRGFLEIHIDQSRGLARADEPIGAVTALAGRMRVAAEVRGEADHAGTTPRDERRDALAAAARLMMLAEDLATAEPGFVVTPTRILAEPNAQSTIASRVRLWLDARAPEVERVDAWRDALEAGAAEIATQRRVDIALRTDSRSVGARFDPEVIAALRAAGATTETICFAGHDAGVLAEHVPAGMVLVRNATGISHHAAEHVELADAAVAANAVATAIGALA